MSRLFATSEPILCSVLVAFSSLFAPAVVAQTPAMRTDVAAITPAVVSPSVPATSQMATTPPVAEGHRPGTPWQIALVQTALTEQGCPDVGITGKWDQPTEKAIVALLSLPQVTEAIVHDISLISLLRSSPRAACARSSAFPQIFEPRPTSRPAISRPGAKSRKELAHAQPRFMRQPSVIAEKAPPSKRAAKPTGSGYSAVARASSVSSGRPMIGISAF